MSNNDAATFIRLLRVDATATTNDVADATADVAVVIILVLLGCSNADIGASLFSSLHNNLHVSDNVRNIK